MHRLQNYIFILKWIYLNKHNKCKCKTQSTSYYKFSFFFSLFNPFFSYMISIYLYCYYDSLPFPLFSLLNMHLVSYSHTPHWHIALTSEVWYIKLNIVCFSWIKYTSDKIPYPGWSLYAYETFINNQFILYLIKCILNCMCNEIEEIQDLDRDRQMKRRRCKELEKFIANIVIKYSAFCCIRIFKSVSGSQMLLC